MRIYCDANASTPIDPRVMEVYVEALETGWANPSSPHREGQLARSMLLEARERCAKLFHVLPRQIIFYSSATEALNSLVPALFRHISGPLVTSNIDHSALLEPCLQLANYGVTVDSFPVGERGALQLSQMNANISLPIGGIATSIANSETGITVDVEALSSFARIRSIPLLLDGVAALGKMPLMFLPGMTALCFASHKVYAPKGVGMAIVAKDCSIEPLLRGGGQESGRRAGTENVPAIYAFSYALKLLLEEQQESIQKLSTLRDLFEQRLTSSLPGIQVHGGAERVCNVSNLYIDGVVGEELMMVLDQQGVAISVGSACASGALEPSRVLTSMYSRKHALSSVRLSFSKCITHDDIEKLLHLMKKAIVQLR